MRNTTFADLLKLTSRAFLLDAAVWLILGIQSLILAVDTGNVTRWVYTILMFANAAMLIWFGVVILRARIEVFTLAIVYMIANVVVLIFDQFGLVDALVMSLNLVVLGLLVLTRGRLVQETRMPPQE
jgi:hypothetical protein